jgi:hypothetical protein
MISKTSKEIAETVQELNDDLQHADGLHLEFSQIGYVDAVILHQDNGRGEVALWCSEDTTEFSKKTLMKAIARAKDDLEAAEKTFRANMLSPETS